jgi:uncharacterized membrane protein
MEFILLIVLFFYALSLSKRISTLEQKLKDNPTFSPSEVHRESSVAIPQEYRPAAVEVPFTSIPAAIETPVTPAYIPQPPAEDKLIRFFKEDFLVKLGALLLLLAFGWGVSYAFANNWIGPVGRIVLGLGAGVSVMAFGTFWMRKNFHQAAIFLVLGLGLFNLTIFAARFIYDFGSPILALVVMFVAVAYVASLSVLKNSQNLALACLVFAGISPLFTAGEPSAVGLFSYLLLFVLGVLWVVYVRLWHALTFAALLVVSLYSLPYIFGDASNLELLFALVFAQVFGIVFFLFNGLNIARGMTDVSKEHIYTGLGIGLFLTAWVWIPSEGLPESVVFSLWAIAHFVAAGYFYFSRQNLKAFYLYGAVGLLFTAVATAILFEGHTLTLAYTIETGLVVLLAQLIIGRAELTKRLCALFLGPILLSIPSFTASTWNERIVHGDFFVLWVLMVTLVVVGLVLRSLEQGMEMVNLKQTANALLSIGIGYAFLIIIRSLGVYYDSTLLTLAFIIESGVAVFLVHAIYNSPRGTAIFSYILGLSVVASMPSLTAATWSKGVIHEDFFVLLAFIGTALLVGFFVRGLNQAGAPAEVKYAYRTLIYTAAIYLLMLVWLCAHALFDSQDIAITVSLIIFTVCGLASYVYGRTTNILHYQYAGGIVLAFVVGRLLLVDVWRMELLERFITFFMVGVLLISTAFYGRKK